MFPTNPEEFDADDRISFSKVSETFILETEDGREFQWDKALSRWTETIDDEHLARQQQAYAVQGVDESEPAMNPRKKRKQSADDHTVSLRCFFCSTNNCRSPTLPALVQATNRVRMG